jgi:histidinol-phosphate phosphatase family protein
VAERTLGDEIADGLGPAVVNAMGRTTLREAMALLTWCRHLITNDSGPMHVASALGVPVTAVFGPTDPRVTGPVGEHVTVIRHPVECSPCRYRDCPIDHPCMTAVSPDEVSQSVKLNGDRTRGDLQVVFLDRDGTLNLDEAGYLADPDRLVLLPGAAEAVRALNEAGVKAVVVTNQSGVGRGKVTPDALDRIHARLTELFASHGARLDGIYACLHRPDEGCGCRKPGTDLALRAARDLGVDPARSAMIGDKDVDLELARRLGGHAVLVLTGQGRETAAGLTSDSKPRYIARDVLDAVSWLLQRTPRSATG